MSAIFPGPTIFAAYAAAAENDPDLRPGTHLRLFPSTRIGFPLAPFAVWKVRPPHARALPVDWFDKANTLLASGVEPHRLDLGATGGAAFGWVTGSLPEDGQLIGVEAMFDDGSGRISIKGVAGDRLLAARTRPLHLVGAPRISRIVVEGRSNVDLIGWFVTTDMALEATLAAPFAILGLPTERQAWYGNGAGPDEAWKRVAEGAPPRLSRPDQPDGPFDPIDGAAEQARIAFHRTEIDAHVNAIVQDAAVLPSSIVETHVWPADVAPRRPWQQATVQVRNALLLQGLDPGVARYLGLMDLLRDLPEPRAAHGDPTATAWLAAGVFAVPADVQLASPDAMEARLLARMEALFPDLQRIAQLARDRGLSVRAFLAPALAAPPPDPLPPPAVSLAGAEWVAEPQGPSVRFRQSFLIQDPPLATLLALARQEPDGWRTRHQMLALAPGSTPRERAATIFLGIRDRLDEPRAGLASDAEIPARGAPWSYRLALSDVFGRFGPPAELSVPAPARPPIPVPALQVHVRHDRLPAAGAGPRPARTAILRVPIPCIEELAAGSKPLASVVVSLDGASQSKPAAAREALFEMPLRDLEEPRRVEAHAHFIDEDGTPGPEAVHAIELAAPRWPAIPHTGIGIVWASRPGPSPDVELRLSFAGQPGARYRLYMSDARALGIPESANGRPRTRAEIAVDGANRALAQLDLQEKFRLMTAAPIEAPLEGVVGFDVTLPRALETVQFVRVVPLSARGIEAPFASCPLTPVAVPSDRRPPAPRIEPTIDPATGVARLRIVAEGLDLVALAAAEPGLFGGNGEASRPPEFRLRRASGVVPEPLYAREIARGALSLVGEGDEQRFEAIVEDPPAPVGMLPYVRYWYWAEVRFPPERRVPPGVHERPVPAGGIQPTADHQRIDAPAAFSQPSPAAMVIRVLPPPRLVDGALVATARATDADWTLDIALDSGMAIHARAVGKARVRILVQAGNLAPVEEPAPLELTDGKLVATLRRSGALPASVRVTAIPLDPLGREGPPLFVQATVA